MSKKDMTVKGAGFTASFWVALDKARRERGVTDDAYYEALKEDSPLIGQFADLIAKSSKVRIAELPVILNYNESLETKTTDGFTYVSPNLTDANFKAQAGKGIVSTKAVFVNFREYVESDEAVSRLDAMGLRPGIPKELADVSMCHANSKGIAQHFPAVALGDSWRYPGGSRRVASLDGNASFRGLHLNVWASRWGDGWWFLAFRK